MKTTHNTILITGGSAGIGFALAKLLSEKGNRVVITGRNKERLEAAALQLKNAVAIQSDVSREKDVNQLVQKLETDFPELNVVINNAGRAILYSLRDENANVFEKAQDEMHTNYLSVIRLNEKLLSLLQKQPEAAIVNVSSIVAFVPGSLAGYSASKAALHAYTQILRNQLEGTPVKVFELMPPLVDTEFSAPIGGSTGIAPAVVAEAFLAAFEKNEYEIRVGQTEDLYRLYLSSPGDAFYAMNKPKQTVNA